MVNRRNPRLNGANSTFKSKDESMVAMSEARKTSMPWYSMSSLPETPLKVAPLFPEVKSPSMLIV